MMKFTTIFIALAFLICPAVSFSGEKPTGNALIKQECPNGYGQWPDLLRANPFASAGKCFHAPLTAVQILSKNEAIAIFYGKSFLLDTGDEAVETKIYDGVVKVIDVYKYRATDGSKVSTMRLRFLY